VRPTPRRPTGRRSLQGAPLEGKKRRGGIKALRTRSRRRSEAIGSRVGWAKAASIAIWQGHIPPCPRHDLPLAWARGACHRAAEGRTLACHRRLLRIMMRQSTLSRPMPVRSSSCHHQPHAPARCGAAGECGQELIENALERSPRIDVLTARRPAAHSYADDGADDPADSRWRSSAMPPRSSTTTISTRSARSDSAARHYLDRRGGAARHHDRHRSRFTRLRYFKKDRNRQQPISMREPHAWTIAVDGGAKSDQAGCAGQALASRCATVYATPRGSSSSRRRTRRKLFVMCAARPERPDVGFTLAAQDARS